MLVFVLVQFLLASLQGSAADNETNMVKFERGKPIDVSSHSRIVGGYPCPIKNHPYMVSIRYTLSYRHHCGGTIVNAHWILTAGHCTRTPYKHGMFTVVAGTSFLLNDKSHDESTQDALVVLNVNHRNPRENDIGLMRVARELVQSAFVKFVKLATPAMTKNVSIEQACSKSIVIGWGIQHARNAQGRPVSRPTVPYNRHLQCVVLPVISKEECSDRFDITVPDTFICTYRAGKDACQGDSGGPLMCGGVQFGIVSSGIGCAYRTFPGVFTRIDLYTGYIREIVSGANKISSLVERLQCFHLLVVISTIDFSLLNI